MRTLVGFMIMMLIVCQTAFSQVDTTFIYKSGMPYGTLDIRLAKSSTRYYYLSEGKTFSFRESSPGVKTNTYRDMTSWDSSPYTQGHLREKNGRYDYFIMNYRLLFPSNYNANYDNGYPIIVMMHGLGERGNCWFNDCYWDDRGWKPTSNSPAAPTSSSSELLNNDHNLLHGGSAHLSARNLAGSRLPDDPSMPERAFPGFVLFPQNLNGWGSNEAQDVIRIVRLLVKKHNIDPDRIYIHGLSNGGAAVFDVIKRAPWLFSAAATMSGVSESGVISKGLLPTIAPIPLWLFQGGQDTAPSPSKTEGYVNKFREAGLSVRYTKYDNLGHGTWNNAYAEPDFFSWIRSQNKTQIHVFGDNPVICKTTNQGARMALAGGFLAYQWERNGTIISGATSATYTATTTGTYRARFSRVSKNPSSSEWNEWSDPVTVTISDPPKAEMSQIGTVILKDLNYYNYARLYSVNEADRYLWYKDGVLQNQKDTTRFPIFKQGSCSGLPECTGNGSYTLVTTGYDYCPSPPSDPIEVIFNNQAPTNISAPVNFTGSATSSTRASLSWMDASNNEGGFEVWRRKVTSPSSKWVMATITKPNVTSFNDTGLHPNSTYQYKIRGVSSTGKSNYTPASSSSYLIIKTMSDTQAPTAPQNVTASSTAIGQLTVSWQASTDNIGIGSYNVYYNSSMVNTKTTATTYTISNLPINTNYTITVRAVDLGGNLSAHSSQAFTDTYVEGLYYEHSTGAWSDLDQINWTKAEYIGKVDNFTLIPRTQEDFFNFEFEGYLYINSGGTYQFRTTSDDGSRLTLNNTVLVENDGLHGNVTKTSANVTLNGGAHTINVKYFENSGGQSLTVQYKGADTNGNWINIPNSALRSGNSSADMMMVTAEDALTVEDPLEAMHASLYPNPINVGNNVRLRIESTKSDPVRVKLVDVMGNTFHDQLYETAQLFDGTELITNSNLTKGIYMVIISQGDKTITQRVVVQE